MFVAKSKIQVKKLHSILKKLQSVGSLVDFLKIEVEGFEILCLEGSVELFDLCNIGIIYIEVGFCSYDNRHTQFEQIFKHLCKYEFSFYGQYDYYHYRKPTELLFCNALFFNERYLKSNNLLSK